MRIMEKRTPVRPAGKFNFPIRAHKGGAKTLKRQNGSSKPSAPFPQKPPYRPDHRNSTDTGASRPRSDLKAVSPRSDLGRQKFVRPKPPRTAYASYAPKERASTSWGAVSSWYDKHLAGSDTYHAKIILPNLLRLVAPEKGEHILDLASGEGYFTRAFAEKGALVTGREISPELVATAQKKSGAGTTYSIGSADDLSLFKDEQFHKAVVVLAIQNIREMQKVFAETSRVLKKDGALHIVMNHPAFRIPKRSGWAYDEKQKIQYRRVEQYLSESRETIDMHPGMKDSPQTLSFHRPLQYYVKALVKAGFVIDRFEEWISHKESDSGPRAEAENRARKEIPLFLYIRARKI